MGLSRKIQVYAERDHVLDIVDAGTTLGLPVEGREYRIAAAVLAGLGARNLPLITNNPQRYLVPAMPEAGA